MKVQRMWFHGDIALPLTGTALFFGSYIMMLAAFPLFLADRGLNETVIGLVGGLFPLAAVIERPFLSKLSSTRGRRVVLLLSAFASATGPLLYLVSKSPVLITLTRTYHALSLAGFLTASQTMLADLTLPPERDRIFALSGLATGLGMVLSPLIGQAISSRFVLPSVFAAAAVAGMGIFVCSLAVRETRIVTGTPAEESTRPVLELSRWLIVPSGAILLLTLALGANGTFLPIYSALVGVSNTSTFFSVFSLSSLVGWSTCSRLSRLLGRRNAALSGIIVSGAGFLCLVNLSGYLQLGGSGLLIGFGSSVCHTALLVVVVNNTSATVRAQAVSFYANAYDLGMALGAIGMGWLAAFSYPAFFVALTGLTLSGAVVLLGLLPVKEKTEYIASCPQDA